MYIKLNFFILCTSCHSLHCCTHFKESCHHKKKLDKRMFFPKVMPVCTVRRESKQRKTFVSGTAQDRLWSSVVKCIDSVVYVTLFVTVACVKGHNGHLSGPHFFSPFFFIYLSRLGKNLHT